MREVAERLGVSTDAVLYVLRRRKVPRRSFQEAFAIAFERKTPSFRLRSRTSAQAGLLDAMGAMLYWAEGYKQPTATGLDFANSDADMILVFWRFLNHRYRLDIQRAAFAVYYYEDQDLAALVDFWRQKLGVPRERFRHHYMKRNANPTARKLPHGVLHIRYHDKKLLRDILNLIHWHRQKYGM